MDKPYQTSNAKRQQKFRLKKVLEDPDYKKKECERIKMIQRKKRGKLTSIQAEELKLRKRMQKRLERDRKKHQKQTSITNGHEKSNSSDVPTSQIHPYTCVQTYQQAISKCLRSLPPCPKKRKLIVEGVCEHLGIRLAEEMEGSLRIVKVEVD